jgi:sporulation protein YlmC with PRC-barrel domain
MASLGNLVLVLGQLKGEWIESGQENNSRAFPTAEADMAAVARDAREVLMLRSVYDMRGYTIRARDGAIGQVDHFLFDDRTGTVRYLVVRIGGWLLGQRVLLPWQRIKNIHWTDSTVEVGLLRATVKRHPTYDQTLLWRQNHIRNGQTHS